MASGKLLRQLIKSGVQGDTDSFRRVSEAVIEEERQKQHHLLANDLEKILHGRPALPHATSGLRQLANRVPVDQDRSLALVEIREPIRQLEDIVLSDENRSALDEIVHEHHRAEILKSHGLRPADRLLFCGPPGCGKTLAAEVLAAELNYPLAVVRTDSVVSSYLGETAASLRKVFDFIHTAPMVVLFDEFDALAKERDDTSEHGELKRVVNAVLQMLDAYTGDSLVIATTNHEHLLDSAIWRRFEEVLVFEPPNSEQLKKLLAAKLRGVRREFEHSDRTVISLFKGQSYADVERVLRRAIKEMILQGQEFLRVHHLENALRREVARQSRQRKLSG